MKTFLKNNKALLFLPLALVPFVVLIFYILGGGTHPRGNEHEKPVTEKQSGANYSIPQADRSIEIVDKLEAYQQEATARKTMSVGYRRPIDHDSVTIEKDTLSDDDLFSTDAGSAQLNRVSQQELLAHIQRQQQLAKEGLQKQGSSQKEGTGSTVNGPVYKKEKPTVPPIRKPGNGSFSGIKELEQVFDQNTALKRQNDSLRFFLKTAQSQVKEQEVNKSMAFSLTRAPENGFNKAPGTSPGQLIKAEVYETTTVLNGNRVKLRLLEDCLVHGLEVKANTFFYGICKINNERLMITVNHFPVKQSFLLTQLTIYDLDGHEGLYVPDNAARKVTKEVGSSANTSSLFGVTADPLTYAGVRAADQTARTFLKRVRLKKVTLKKNTLVYLFNQK